MSRSGGRGRNGGPSDTVGSLLASIATSLNDALRILMFADKRQWGPDEFEQIRVLEAALDEAKKDFQEMGPLVSGRSYYENDQRPESLDELRELRTKFEFHAQLFKDWLRAGGPINPVWARETAHLRRDLHRAQCRIASRIFAADHEAVDSAGPGNRCLGAFIVHRQLRRLREDQKRQEEQLASLPQWQQQHQRKMSDQQTRGKNREAFRQGTEMWEAQVGGGVFKVVRGSAQGGAGVGTRGTEEAGGAGEAGNAGRRGSLEALVPNCNAVGKFERYGEYDIAFVCDYCDGFIIWENLQNMPSTRIPDVISGWPNWQACGKTASEGGEEKTTVFAPLAIANHLPPHPGDYMARLTCPYCDDYTYLDQGGPDDEEEVKWAQNEAGFEDLEEYQGHLELYHTTMPMPSLPIPTPSKCIIM